MDASSSLLDLTIRDLGRMAYANALTLQRQLQQEVIARRRGEDDSGATMNGSARDGGGMTILLVEHDPPVITISRRPGAKNHLIASAAQLRQAGVEVAETDRGGDITYHGPGQLVVYPILDLNRLNLRLHSYMRFLEQIVIGTLSAFGIEGERDPSATGVWVGGESKICALGVRVSRWVSMHGLALNVTTNLDHFNLIVPCGLAGRAVTSMQRELGAAKCPSMDEVKNVMIANFRAAIREAIDGR